MNLEVGSTAGDYQVVGILGAGGMGKVYKVRNVISDRIEAMKVLLPDLANAPELADRFLREIKVQASLEHPNIAALHTALRMENQLLMLMEFVEGVTLEQKLKDGPLPVADAVHYMMQVLAALDYAHARGVIHRDIKPANMMLTTDGVVKLMDFGIAKASTDQRLTMTGTTMGSLYYMSPEQIQGTANLDARADLYSVGVSLYELVTGKRPFDGDSQFAIMAAHLEKMPVPPITLDPSLPQLLNDVILMSVSKDPNARFQTGAAFRNALGSVAATLAPAAASAVAAASPLAAPPPAAMPTAPVAAAPANYAPSPLQPAAPKAARSKRGLWMGVGAVATAAVVIAVMQFGPWRGTKAAPQPAPAVTEAPAAPTSPPVSSGPLTQPAQAGTPTMPANVEQPPAPQTSQPAPATAAAAHMTPAAPHGQPQRFHQAVTGFGGNAAAQQPSGTPAAQVRPTEPAPIPQPAAQQAPAQSQAVAPAPAGASREELQQVREQLALLNARAVAVRTSLDTLREQQRAQGMNLRGDMQVASAQMNEYMQGSRDALQNGDAASAKNFMNKAERQVEMLEKFLGR
ncbi:MAG TPA: protein kinase [Bryobacteraceae bacterium]|nr:protein kinase [Bryobacteraceae bacterium]